jgi:long-chain acyl-CoA synthetase
MLKSLNHAEARSLWQVWQKTAETYPEIVAVYDPHAKPEVKLTYAQLVAKMAEFGAGLRSLGIQAGDHVSLIADNSPRWLIADQGVMAIGAANATRSSQADRYELLYIIKHSDSVALIVEDLATLQKLQPELGSLPIRQILLLSDEVAPEGIYNFSQILEKGKNQDLGDPAIAFQTLATLVYTSGTTSQPKGVMLTHGNLLSQIRDANAMLQPAAGERSLSILPTWHCYERTCEYYMFSQGITQIYTNLRQIKADLKTHKPHYVIAVPRLWESIHEGIQKLFTAESASKQKLIRFLFGQSQKYIEAKRVVNGLSLVKSSKVDAYVIMTALAPIHAIADQLVYKKIRAALGGEIKYLTSGGGSLQPYLDLFYEIVGIQIINGYGLTETSPMLSTRQYQRNLRGSAGVPLPNTEIAIFDPETRQPLALGKTGLVMARGQQIMQGYYKNPEATAKAINPQGWFDTGDLGWVTAKNDLILTGRAKDTIVLTNGENIEPTAIEDAATRSRYIDQIIVVGQDQKQLGALIVPNLSALAADKFIPADTELSEVANLPNGEKIKALYRDELNREIKNRPGFSPNDRISIFSFVPEPFTIENGLMTQTFKVRRNMVNERYQDLISKMFA